MTGGGGGGSSMVGGRRQTFYVLLFYVLCPTQTHGGRQFPLDSRPQDGEGWGLAGGGGGGGWQGRF